jgi:hypothetical protein
MIFVRHPKDRKCQNAEDIAQQGPAVSVALVHGR